MSLHPDEALKVVLADLPMADQDLVPLYEASGRYLIKGLPALIDQPPFDKSAMDGYAFTGAPPEPGSFLRCGETIAAGADATLSLAEGFCARIMTGAPLPPGTVGVQRREYTREENGRVLFTQKEGTDNIIRRGENQRAGDLLLTPRRLQAQDIGILASSGYSLVPVAKKPRVGIVSTGDELAECGESLSPSRIYDSNGPQLTAQTSALGCDARFYGIVGDDRRQLQKLLGRSLEECDVTIVSGAVSLGDFDFVPETFAALGVTKLFHGLKMRPGKPTFYGILNTRAVFGLPGNPVSTFVNFEILVKPHLLKRLGSETYAHELALPLSESHSRRGCDRVEYLPGIISPWEGPDGGVCGSAVRPLSYRGSSMLSALAEANCLFRMDMGVETISQGGIVHARLIRP